MTDLDEALNRCQTRIQAVSLALRESEQHRELALAKICEQRLEELFVERQRLLDSIPTQREGD